jgi:hypothetical protein
MGQTIGFFHKFDLLSKADPSAGTLAPLPRLLHADGFLEILPLDRPALVAVQGTKKR